MLNEQLGKDIKEGIVHYIHNNERRAVVMNPMLEEEIKSLVLEVNDLLKSEEPPIISMNKNKCNVCGLREVCQERFV